MALNQVFNGRKIPILTTTPAQSKALADKWNALAIDPIRYGEDLIEDLHEIEMDANGRARITVPADKSKDGKRHDFYIYPADVTAV